MCSTCFVFIMPVAFVLSLSLSAAMKKKYQASSDDDEPSKKTLLQTQQTQDQEAQSQQSTPHSPFLFWAILFGCIILIVLGVLCKFC